MYLLGLYLLLLSINVVVTVEEYMRIIVGLSLVSPIILTSYL